MFGGLNVLGGSVKGISKARQWTVFCGSSKRMKGLAKIPSGSHTKHGD